MPTAAATDSSILNAVLTAVMLGLMGWTLLTVHNLTNQVAIINNTVQIGLTETYPRSVAEGETNLLKQRIKRLEEWDQALSERIRNLENAVQNR